MEEQTLIPTPTPPNPTPCWSSIVSKPPLPKPQEDLSTKNQVFEECKSSHGISVAVIDANAIIQGGEKIKDYADKFVSVVEVMDEIRDPVSRQKLEFLPFTIDKMEPSDQALKTVINFARATGDLQTLSDVDLKLIALTYTLEAQIHGTKHLKDSPPPVHMINVRRMDEKDMPGWGSNVPNLEEWEALEQSADVGSNSESKILPLKDLSLNVIPTDSDSVDGSHNEDQEGNGNLRKPRRYAPIKKEINIEGKMVSDGIDASQGQADENASDWLPAVSRSTHRRFLRRKARCELSEKEYDMADTGTQNNDEDDEIPELIHEGSEEENQKAGNDDLSSVLNQMRLEEDSSVKQQEEKDMTFNEENGFEICDEGSDLADISSHTNESVDASIDDMSSEQSWRLRSLSESSVACVTSDFAMQNVILQMGLRLLAPGGMQIRQLHRWILKCHACNKVTAEIGRIFCPKCGNGGTLRKVAVTVNENGIILAGRKPRVILRGTKFSLPLPQGGREAVTKNLILREDQLPHKVLYPKTKKKVNKEGDDIFVSDDIFRHSSDKRAPLQPPIRKALAVFSGKRNPNDNHYTRASAKH
ncbi:hypothetical protein ACHQM5_027346 [Ranunculus cassubicifolius]